MTTIDVLELLERCFRRSPVAKAVVFQRRRAGGT
ncbi:hypothetical protein BH09ACT13_BH09ACT13_15410 [soil metagenome]